MPLRNYITPARNLEGSTVDLERTWYEASPYIYMVSAIIVILRTESSLGLISGALLLAVSSTILRLRWVYRKQQNQRRPTYKNPWLPQAKNFVRRNASGKPVGA